MKGVPRRSFGLLLCAALAGAFAAPEAARAVEIGRVELGAENGPAGGAALAAPALAPAAGILPVLDAIAPLVPGAASGLAAVPADAVDGVLPEAAPQAAAPARAPSWLSRVAAFCASLSAPGGRGGRGLRGPASGAPFDRAFDGALENKTITNFGGNLRFTPKRYYSPRNEAELLEILNRHREGRIRVAASRHSWSPLIVSEDALIDMGRFDGVQFNGNEVKAGGGIVLQDLLDRLRKRGLTLPTMGEIRKQTIAGAISTATHGSGHASLSGFIKEITVAAYDQESGKAKLFTFSSGPELEAARAALGRMGVIVSVKFDAVKIFNVEEVVQRYSSLDEVLAQEEKYPLQDFVVLPDGEWKTFVAFHRRETDAGLTRWLPRMLHRVRQFVGTDFLSHLLIRRVAAWGDGRTTRRFYRSVAPLTIKTGRPVVDDNEHALTQARDLFRYFEMESFVPRDKLPRALRLIQEVTAVFSGTLDMVPSTELVEELRDIGMLARLAGSKGRHVINYPLGVRRVMPEQTLISMTAHADQPYYSIGIFTYGDASQWGGFRDMADFLAKSLAALYGVKPHWGKFYPLDGAETERLYPRLPRFREIVRRYDPRGVFGNKHTDEVLGLSRTPNGGR